MWKKKMFLLIILVWVVSSPWPNLLVLTKAENNIENILNIYTSSVKFSLVGGN